MEDKRMKRRWRELVAFVLSVSILLNSLPVTAAKNANVAETETATKNASTEESVIATGSQETAQQENEAYIVNEITEKREPDTKYFLMSDRSIKACVYPQTVHYLHNGSYEEIDNRLEYKTDVNANGIMKIRQIPLR